MYANIEKFQYFSWRISKTILPLQRFMNQMKTQNYILNAWRWQLNFIVSNEV